MQNQKEFPNPHFPSQRYSGLQYYLRPTSRHETQCLTSDICIVQQLSLAKDWIEQARIEQAVKTFS